MRRSVASVMLTVGLILGSLTGCSGTQGAAGVVNGETISTQDVADLSREIKTFRGQGVSSAEATYYLSFAEFINQIGKKEGSVFTREEITQKIRNEIRTVQKSVVDKTDPKAKSLLEVEADSYYPSPAYEKFYAAGEIMKDLNRTGKISQDQWTSIFSEAIRNGEVEINPRYVAAFETQNGGGFIDTYPWLILNNK